MTLCYLHYETQLPWKSQGSHFPYRVQLIDSVLLILSALKQPALLMPARELQKLSTSASGINRDWTCRAKAEPSNLHCSSASYRKNMRPQELPSQRDLMAHPIHDAVCSGDRISYLKRAREPSRPLHPTYFVLHQSCCIKGVISYFLAQSSWYPSTCMNLWPVNLSNPFLTLLVLSNSTNSCGSKLQKYTTSVKKHLLLSILNFSYQLH